MENQITIREAIGENDVAVFWDQLHTYHKRDIFPNPDSEDLEYFLGSEYYDHMMKIHSRPQDRCYYLFFHRDGQDIGFAMPVIYTTEDGKCFIMEFCVYPEFRGGTGTECARLLLEWAREQGAQYAELNFGGGAMMRIPVTYQVEAWRPLADVMNEYINHGIISTHDNPILSKRLVDCELSVRTLNICHANGIETLGDLTKLHKTDWLKFRNGGKKSLIELDDLLHDNGLDWAEWR